MLSNKINMFGKAEISRTEHKLILFVTLTIPIILIGFLSTELYNFFIPTSSTFPIVHWEAKPTLPLFRICLFLSLTVSFIFLIYKKVLFSILTFILPVISLIPFIFVIKWRIQEILETATDLETINYYKETSLFWVVFENFDNTNIYLLAFGLIILFWQISILLRMLIKTSQKESVLP